MVAIFTEESHSSGCRAVFDDDGRVAYAYLVVGDEILADVWVYNRLVASDSPEWDNPEATPPFLNASRYVLDTPAVLPMTEEDVAFKWSTKEGLAVDVLIFGDLFARLRPGSRPGWARLAKADGPVAKRLS